MQWKIQLTIFFIIWINAYIRKNILTIKRCVYPISLCIDFNKKYVTHEQISSCFWVLSYWSRMKRNWVAITIDCASKLEEFAGNKWHSHNNTLSIYLFFFLTRHCVTPEISEFLIIEISATISHSIWFFLACLFASIAV